MKNLASALSTVLLILLSGCATVPMAPAEMDARAKDFSPPAEKASLYIYRDEMFGAVAPMTVTINGRTLGQTAAKTFFRLNLLPGRYSIESHAENIATLALSMEAGRNYFVWQEVKMGLWLPRSLLRQTDEATGHAGVLESKLIASNIPDNDLLPLAPARAAPTARAAGDLVPYSGMGDQFEIDLPAGWSVYDQGLVLSGKPGRTSPLPVVFCSEPIDGRAMMSGDSEAQRKVTEQLVGIEAGALPGFVLDRLPAKRGMTCGGFDAGARQKLLDLMSTDPMFGQGRTVLESPRAEPMPIGGCQGLRVQGRGTGGSGGGKHLDVFAVSDGEVLFLFKLANLDEHYPRNVGLFERIVSTLRLTGAAAPRR